jgi:valyl-tRNA synthetase
MIHGLIRDSLGRKMSKSLGNGIDPLEVISKYGADALRLTLITGNSPGNDMRFYWEKVENSRNFANKIWNASRFIMMNLPDGEIELPFDRDFTTADRWIISLVNTLAKDVTENLDKFELGIAVQKVYDFLWDEFCDWYIESVKSRIYGKEGEASKNAALFTLREVLSRALKLLHPFMPFITEEIYCTLHPECDTIMTAKWPEYSKTLAFKKDEEAYSHIKDFVRAVRNVRTEMNVPPSKKVHVYAVSEDKNIRETFNENSLLLSTLAGTSGISVVKNTSGVEGGTDSCVSQGIAGATLYLPIAELVDAEKEKERLTKEKERLLAELKRSDSMLNNERFLSKAPAEKVAAEKEKREKYQKMYDDLMSRLEKL